jgi:hypothetical protein
VGSVSDNSPGSKAGLKAGDVITRYDGKAVERWSDLPRAVAETPLSREVPVEVMRDGKKMTLNAKIARLEEQDQRAEATTEQAATKLGLAGRTLTPGPGAAARHRPDEGRRRRAGRGWWSRAERRDHRRRRDRGGGSSADRRCGRPPAGAEASPDEYPGVAAGPAGRPGDLRHGGVMDIWEDRFIEVCRRHRDLVAVYESPRGRLALLLRQTLVPLAPEHFEWLAETRATARAVIADLRGVGVRRRYRRAAVVAVR